MPKVRLNLLDLSEEVIFLVLGQIDSLIDLRCFIQSTQAVFRVFESSKAVLVSDVFNNSLQPAVREAAMTYALSNHLLQHPSSQPAWRAVRKLLSSTKPSPSYSSTPSLARLLDPGLLHHHSIIESFTRLIARFCFSYAQRRCWSDPDQDNSQQQLSQTETSRIQRALYRYDILCTLHQYSLSHPASNIALDNGYLNTNYWMHTLTPWEMDELGCVHDILYSLSGSMTVAFRDVRVVRVATAQDVNDTQGKGNWQSIAEAWMRPQVMSRGLKFMAQLFRAQSKWDRVRLLDDLIPPLDLSMTTSAFHQLVSCTYKPVVSVPTAQLQSPPSQLAYQRDSNNVSGPNAGWYWAVIDANTGKTWRSWCSFKRQPRPRRRPLNGQPGTRSLMAFSRQYYLEAHASLRIWGWCFWDGWRIQEWMAYRAARTANMVE